MSDNAKFYIKFTGFVALAAAPFVAAFLEVAAR